MLNTGMRLLELIDITKPKGLKKKGLVPKTGKPGRSEVGIGRRHEKVGQGATAKVFKSRKPNTIIRVGFVNGPKDPYLRFLRTIMEHQDNPYFPRIYNAKLYKTGERADKRQIAQFRKPQSALQLILEMEKLVPAYDSPMQDAVEHKLHQLSVIPEDFSYDISTPAATSKTSTDLKWVFRDEINRIIRETPDPAFAEALTIIRDVAKDKGNLTDLHLGNLMVRPTGVGPQIVLIDPILPEYFPYPWSV